MTSSSLTSSLPVISPRPQEYWLQGITAELTVPAVSQNDQLLNPEVRCWGEGSEMPLQKASLKASHMTEQEAAVCSVTHSLVFPLPLSLSSHLSPPPHPLPFASLE